MGEQKERDWDKARKSKRKPKWPGKSPWVLEARDAEYPSGKYEWLGCKRVIDGTARTRAEYEEAEYCVEECDPDLTQLNHLSPTTCARIVGERAAPREKLKKQ